MGILMSKNGIRYEMLSEANLFGAVNCVSDSFTKNEPMSHHLGITHAEFANFAQACYSELIDEQLSLVAIDESTDQVIGVRISQDYCRQDQELYIDDLSPKFFPLFSLLDELSLKFRESHKILPGAYAHMFMVAVAERFNCRGIAPTMYRLFLNIAIERGFTWAVTEPTGMISQHILGTKFGFHELHRVNYADFEFEGTRPFADLKGHDCAKLMEKKLIELSHLLTEVAS